MNDFGDRIARDIMTDIAIALGIAAAAGGCIVAFIWWWLS